MLITSKDNRFLRLFRELGHKKYREEYGLFPAEGKRLIDDLIGAGLSPHFLLYAEDFKDIAFLEKAAAVSDRVLSVSRSAFSSVSDTQNGQGIAAAFPCLCPELASYRPGVGELILILNEIRDPGNLGTVIRSAAAAGVGAVLLEKGSVDLYNPKVIRATMGTVARVPVFTDLSFEAILSFLDENGVDVYIAGMEEPVCYHEVPVSGKTAVVFGNEGNGISARWRERSFSSLMIPMENGVESLNVAVAASVIAFDHRRRIAEIKNLK